MATLKEAIRVYKYNRSTRLLTGLNTVLYAYKRHGMEFKPKVMEAIVFGEHQKWLKQHKLIDFKKLKKATAGKLKNFYPLPDFKSFEELFGQVETEIHDTIYGIGRLTTYDIALRIGFLYDDPLLPQDYVYIQSGALDGIKALSADPAYKSLFPERKWKAEAYPIADFTAAFGDLESMYIEDFLCVFHNELASLATCSVKDLQTKLLTYTNI